MESKIKDELKKIFPPQLNEIKRIRVGMGNVIFIDIEIEQDNQRVLFYKNKLEFEGKKYVLVYDVKYKNAVGL